MWVDGTLEKISDVYGKSGEYVYKSVEAGKTMKAPGESEVIAVTNDSGVSLKLAGWYLDDGREWNFDYYLVTSSFTLYPVWEEVTAEVPGSDAFGENTVIKRYWPVFFEGVVQEDDGSGADICVCLPEGTSSMPKENLTGGSIAGWEKPDGTTESEKIWDPLVDSVKKVTVLREWKEPAP